MPKFLTLIEIRAQVLDFQSLLTSISQRTYMRNLRTSDLGRSCLLNFSNNPSQQNTAHSYV